MHDASQESYSYVAALFDSYVLCENGVVNN